MSDTYDTTTIMKMDLDAIDRLADTVQGKIPLHEWEDNVRWNMAAKLRQTAEIIRAEGKVILMPIPAPVPMTPARAKKIIRETIRQTVKDSTLDFPLTARTVKFTERTGAIFVTVHRWMPSVFAAKLQAAAKENGFYVEFDSN